jgi:hypothetical protein
MLSLPASSAHVSVGSLVTRFNKVKRRTGRSWPHHFVLPVSLITAALSAALLLAGCTRQAPAGNGVSQLPVQDTSTTPASGDADELAWQISFVNAGPLSYSRDVVGTYIAGPDFTAEMTFSAVVGQASFETSLKQALKATGGDPMLTWESPQSVVFDVRGCQGRARVDLSALARQAGMKRVAPLVIYCGSPRDVLKWSADRGTRIVGSVPANLTPASASSEGSTIFRHRMRSADGSTDVGIWLADFSGRTLKPLVVHYLSVEARTAFIEDYSLVVSTGGDDLQLFGSNGVRVRQFDPAELGLIVGMAVDGFRDRIAIFEGVADESGRTGEARLRLLDRNLDEIGRLTGTGRLSRLSGKWRTVDATWLDSDTIAFIHWDNRFYGVVAVANISTLTVARTAVVADELAGVLADGRFVVRRQAGGRAGCWRVEAPDGVSSSPLCDRLPGPVHAEVSPDGNLVALRLPDTREVVVWNRVTGERRRIGNGELGGWTPSGELVWIAEQVTLAEAEDSFL